MRTKKSSHVHVVDASRTGSLYAIGAGFRSVGIGVPIPEDTAWMWEGPTHVVRALSAVAAVRTFLADFGGKCVENWNDSDTSQRLLYVCRVEFLPFAFTPGHYQPTKTSDILVSDTHRKSNGAPIRYLWVGR